MLFQMSLTQDNKMIHTLAPDRPDQPFGKAILPRRGGRAGLVPDAHGMHSACDNAPVDPIPIAERRVCCDVDPDQVSAAQTDDDKGKEQVEADSWNDE